MTKYSLDDIKKKVNELALKINAPTNLLPSYGQQTWDAHPYIEVDSLGFMFYIISERGQEYERKMTNKIDELLYWVFANVTFSIACAYELKNRIEDKDCRRMMFDKQEQLLGQLNDNWRQKENAEHQSILRTNPFDDLAGLRATYSGQLRQQGHSETEINKLAYAKYPDK
ncbi:MAG: Imm63 family immunity protein [Bacteroidia bacterium]